VIREWPFTALLDDGEVLLGSRPEYTDLTTDERQDALNGKFIVVEDLAATALMSVQRPGCGAGCLRTSGAPWNAELLVRVEVVPGLVEFEWRSPA
jgi:hypothetical protein